MKKITSLYYIRKFWKRNLLTSILLLMNSFFQITQSIVLMESMTAIAEGNLNRVLLMQIVNIGAWGLILFMRRMRDISMAKSMALMNNQIREDISKKVASKSYGVYHERDTGEYISWYTNDVNKIEVDAFKSIFDIVSYISQTIMAVVSLFFIHWSLAAITIPVAVLMLYAPRLFNKKLNSVSKSLSENQEKFVGSVKDALSGADVVKSFGLKDLLINQIKDASYSIESFRIIYARIKATCNMGVNGISIVFQAVTTIQIAILSTLRIISVGTLFGGGNIASMVYNGLASIMSSKLSLTSAQAYLDKLELDLEEKELLPEQILPPVKNEIALQDVSFGYGDKEVLQNLSLNFAIGGKYALVGASGCGKSTVLKLILGMLGDYQGEILLDGKNAKAYAEESYYRQMAYISQDVFLFNSTIRENITLGGNFTQQELEQAVKDSALLGDLGNLEKGLDTEVGENGRNLSGGQKQRVAIARALIHKRSILLVDEGTSALDKKNADLVEEALLENPNLTLILVSHHLGELQKEKFTQVYQMNTVGVTVGQ